MLDRRRSFERIALQHVPSLHRTALRLCRDADDAQDLVQDALVKAYRFFHRFEPGSNERAWLFKVMVNLFYNRYRRVVRERRLAQEVVDGDHVDRFVSQSSVAPTRDPERRLIERLSGERLRDALDDLPADFRAAVLLCDAEGFSYAEIADILGCPIGTVMSRIYRGRRALRRMLMADESVGGEGARAVDLDEYRRNRGGTSS